MKKNVFVVGEILLKVSLSFSSKIITRKVGGSLQ